MKWNVMMGDSDTVGRDALARRRGSIDLQRRDERHAWSADTVTTVLSYLYCSVCGYSAWLSTLVLVVGD
jgi:hypothetical protein